MIDKWKRTLCLLTTFVLLFLTGCKNIQTGNRTEDRTEGTTREQIQESTQQNNVEEATRADESETDNLDDVTLDGMSRDIMASMTLEEKVGQLIFTGMDGLTDNSSLRPGGVILYSKNMLNQKKTKKLIADLQEDSRIPLFVGTEEAGGDNSRIASVKGMKIESQPSSAALAAAKDIAKVEDAAAAIASYMKELGFNLNFAPSANLAQEGNSSILGENSYGSDGKKTGEFLAVFVKGLQENGIISVLSPFPGLGAAVEDTRKGPVDITKTINELRKTELVPFAAGIETGADFVQVGHASYSAIMGKRIPASLSKLMVTEVLKKELRYDGLIITDSMHERAITDVYTVDEAAVKAVKAGVDMLLYPGEEAVEAFESVLQAVEEGEIEESRIEESVLRILRKKLERGIIPEDTDLIDTKN